MTHQGMIIAGIALLAAGTYLMRFAGVRLGNRLPISERTQQMLSDASSNIVAASESICWVRSLIGSRFPSLTPANRIR